MAFTRKHYKAIAEILNVQTRKANTSILNKHYLQGIDHATSDIADDLASMFASDNERFDRNRFMSACGIE